MRAVVRSVQFCTHFGGLTVQKECGETVEGPVEGYWDGQRHGLREIEGAVLVLSDQGKANSC